LIGVQIKNRRLRRVDNRLAYIDQASFLGLRALAAGLLVQCTWIYERVVDMDRLYHFHGNLGYGL
jgi:diacylglycerol O-acyltransferase / wax synthase